MKIEDFFDSYGDYNVPVIMDNNSGTEIDDNEDVILATKLPLQSTTVIMDKFLNDYESADLTYMPPSDLINMEEVIEEKADDILSDLNYIPIDEEEEKTSAIIAPKINFSWKEIKICPYTALGACIVLILANIFLPKK